MVFLIVLLCNDIETVLYRWSLLEAFVQRQAALDAEQMQ